MNVEFFEPVGEVVRAAAQTTRKMESFASDKENMESEMNLYEILGVPVDVCCTDPNKPHGMAFQTVV